MSNIKVIAIAGSTRTNSFNKLLVKNAAAGAEEAGAEVVYIDLRDYPMPLYDQDLEMAEGIPENGLKLKKMFIESQGLIISSPEYNSSISAVLKNSIDWISRQSKGEQALAAFDGKVAGLLSASPGGLGGIRGLVHLRSILGNIKVTVLPDQVAVSHAHEAFTDQGILKDNNKLVAVKAIGAKVYEVARRLNA